MRKRSKLLLFVIAAMIVLPASVKGTQWLTGQSREERFFGNGIFRSEWVKAGGPGMSGAEHDGKPQIKNGRGEEKPAPNSVRDVVLASARSGAELWEEETGYAYSSLDGEKKKVYGQILKAITGFGEDVELAVADADQVGDLMDCVMADHPEIFYVDGYSCTTHMRDDEVQRITFTARYTLTEEEILIRQEKMKEYAAAVLEGMDKAADDYGKLKYLYDYIIRNTEYVPDAPENQTLCSVILYGQSVCQGYAKAFQYLCKEAGISAVMVTGTVKGEGHAWNLVKADGEWYYVDPTWGDARYRLEDADPVWGQENGPEVNYDYFLVTTDLLSRTHTPGDLFALPACTSMEDNYYVRENAYFTGVDQERIASLFAAARRLGQEMVTLKCADDEVYESLRRRLLDDQEIFTYLPGNSDTVAYVDSREQLSLSFWL